MHKMLMCIAFLATVLLKSVYTEECGQEELSKCARPLEFLSSTLDIATNKEEFKKLCPDLYAGIYCIRSYTRRCMSLGQRREFMKLYNGTGIVIKELCSNVKFQDEYLKHAPCFKKMDREYDKCAKKYQYEMSFLHEPPPSANQSDNIAEGFELLHKICCSFNEYLDCSEEKARQHCGIETARFTRNLLDTMASSIKKSYCEFVIKERACYSAAIKVSLDSVLVISVLLNVLYYVFNFR